MGRVWIVALALLVAACAPQAEREPPPPSTPKAEPVQWVQFGMVLRVTPVTLKVDGADSAGMRLKILLDSGEELELSQPLSQAGRFNQGDRVRVLRIGDFTGVTFWPYGNFPNAPQAR